MKVFTVFFSEGTVKIAFATVVKADVEKQAVEKAKTHVAKFFPNRKLEYSHTKIGSAL